MLQYRNSNFTHLSDLIQADINDFPRLAVEVDDSGRLQRAINSLQGKQGSVLLQATTYVISTTLAIPENVGLLGVLAGRSMRSTSVLAGTVIQWNGSTNGTMVKFDNDVHTVYNAKLTSVGFDGKNIAGVIGVDSTNSCYMDIMFCVFHQIDKGIYANGTSYWNRVMFCHFDYYNKAGIYLQNDSNAWNIFNNTINSNGTHPANGIYISGSNGVQVTLNQFELGMNGDTYVTVASGSDVTILANRFESLWDTSQSQTSMYCIQINSGADNTHIIGNKFYSQEKVSGTTYDNDAYNVNDQGTNTHYDAYFTGKQWVMNPKIRQINSAFPMWNQSTAFTSLSVDGTTGDTIVNVNNSTTKYPFVNQYIDATPLRGKKMWISAKFKADNITTQPRVECFAYQGGNGSNANQGTYVGGAGVSLYNSGEYETVYSSFTVPTTADYIMINVNTNAAGSATPANNNVYIHHIALAETKVTELSAATDHFENLFMFATPTAARPTKPFWWNGSTFVDATGSTASAYGTTSIAASTTSIAVGHGLGATPTFVDVTPQGNVGNVWVSGINSTQFTVNCSTAPAAATTVSWHARV